MKQLIYVFIVSFSIVVCIFVIIPKQYFCINNQLNNNNNEIINGAHHVDDNNNIFKTNNGMSGKIENFVAYKKIKYFWANGKKWVDHGEYTEPLNMVKENAPIQRCWGTLPTHEQGCFAHVFNAYGKKYSMHVKVMKSQEMHSFRLIKQHPPPLWRPIPTTPFLHYCCAKYAERVDGLNKCKELLRKGEAC